MIAHFDDARDLIGVAAARAACVEARTDLRTSWYVAQVGLGIPRKRLARLLRADKSYVLAWVREIEESRDCERVDARLTRIERRAARWAM